MSRALAWVRANDWEGLYVDGHLYAEGHRITPGDVMDAVGLERETIWADDEWLSERGELPQTLAEVQRGRP